MKKQSNEAIERIYDAIETAAVKTALNIPGDALEILQNIHTDRGGQLRMLANPRKSNTDRERYVLRMVPWHRGSTGGSLWGPMMAQWLVEEKDDRDRLENLCMLYNAVLTGNPSKAAERWKQALGR